MCSYTNRYRLMIIICLPVVLCFQVINNNNNNNNNNKNNNKKKKKKKKKKNIGQMPWPYNNQQ